MVEQQVPEKKRKNKVYVLDCFSRNTAKGSQVKGLEVRNNHGKNQSFTLQGMSPVAIHNSRSPRLQKDLEIGPANQGPFFTK